MPDKQVSEQDLAKVLNNLDGKMLLAIAVKANELLEARTEGTLYEILLGANELQNVRVSEEKGLTRISAEAPSWDEALGFIQVVSRQVIHGGIPVKIGIETEPTRKEVMVDLGLVMLRVPDELAHAGKEGIKVQDALKLFSKPERQES